MDFIQTRASLLKKDVKSDYETTSFVAHKSKRKALQAETEESSKTSSEVEEFNIKKARQEVIKFGVSGFDAEKKEEARIAKLIKLGAKPPKNKYKNYKQLQMEKKEEQDQKVKEQQMQQLGKNKLGKSTAKGKSFDRKRRKDNILDIYGKIVKQNINKD